MEHDNDAAEVLLCKYQPYIVRFAIAYVHTWRVATLLLNFPLNLFSSISIEVWLAQLRILCFAIFFKKSRSEAARNQKGGKKWKKMRNQFPGTIPLGLGNRTTPFIRLLKQVGFKIRVNFVPNMWTGVFFSRFYQVMLDWSFELCTRDGRGWQRESAEDSVRDEQRV